jgi:rhodanese-related sulfurtransferase/DNA-binding transcriptional ArsR family regulator
MADRAAKDPFFDSLAEAAKALANGRRAEIVDILSQGERSVEDLAGEIGQSTANTSQHLQRLLRAGLVGTRRRGTRIFYSLSGPSVGRLWRMMRQVATEHVAELDELAASYLGDRSTLQTMDRESLRRRLADGDVVLVDVRPEPEFRAGHIPGAVSIPIAELTRRIAELPAEVDVVAYCRGPFCVYADDAVRLLTAHDRRAARLEDGFPEWAEAGLPVERAEADVTIVAG